MNADSKAGSYVTRGQTVHRWPAYAERGARMPTLYDVERWPIERARRRGVSGPLFAIYVGLLALCAGFGVFAVYQGERYADVADYADLIAGKNALLSQRVRDLETIRDSLAVAVAQAYERDPAQLLARLDAMQESWPAAADTDTFVKLWLDAHDRAREDATQPDEARAQDRPQEGLPEGLPEGPQAHIEASSPLAVEDSPGETSNSDETLADFDTAAGKSETETPAPAETERAEPAIEQVAVAPSERAAAKPGIVLRAREETWIQILDESGTPLFTRLMKPDEIHAAAPAAALLITGHPTGLDVFVDGAPAPAFNAKGPRRREIALDPARLMAGGAELPKRPREVAQGPK